MVATAEGTVGSEGTAKSVETVGALVLAAGLASRMGGRPKCLLEWDGEALIRQQVKALLAVGLRELVVVLGHYADEVEQALSGLAVRVVRNPRPQDGQVSSQRLGLQALPMRGQAVLVSLADLPLIGTAEIQALIDAFVCRPADSEVLVPTVGGLPGNPVLLSARVRDAVLAGDASMGCKQWQQAHPTGVHRWATNNPAYRLDLDTPEDVAALRASWGVDLHWPQSARQGLPH